MGLEGPIYINEKTTFQKMNKFLSAGFFKMLKSFPLFFQFENNWKVLKFKERMFL